MTLPAPVLTTVAFVVALGVLVFVHELGHFMVAKRVGVKVDRFSIGFGPVLLSWRRDETEYAISAVPLGGYVKMQGEDDEEEAAADPARSFSTQSPLRRGAIVAAGPAMNFVFAFLMYFVLFASVGAEVPSPAPRVGGVAQGSPAEHAGLEIGDTIVSVDGRVIATWEELSKAVTASGGQALRLEVERAGRRFPALRGPGRSWRFWRCRRGNGRFSLHVGLQRRPHGLGLGLRDRLDQPQRHVMVNRRLLHVQRHRGTGVQAPDLHPVRGHRLDRDIRGGDPVHRRLGRHHSSSPGVAQRGRRGRVAVGHTYAVAM